VLHVSAGLTRLAQLALDGDMCDGDETQFGAHVPAW
jgi:hypothetical protein